MLSAQLEDIVSSQVSQQNGDDCPEGYYCPLGTSVKYPTTFCAAGEYCPLNSVGVTACVAETYQNAPRQAACRQCPAGYTCATGATAFAASPCTAGNYCPAGSSVVTQCPMGTYSNGAKRGALTDCIDCDPGSYCDTLGQTAVTGNCTAGYFCTLKSTEAAPAVYSALTGGPCTIGNYCPVGSTIELSCPPKKYCSTVNLVADEGDCDAGYYCVGGATTNQPTDLSTHGGEVCPMGSYCPAGTSSPIPCPPGRFNSASSWKCISKLH